MYNNYDSLHLNELYQWKYNFWWPLPRRVHYIALLLQLTSVYTCRDCFKLVPCYLSTPFNDLSQLHLWTGVFLSYKWTLFNSTLTCIKKAVSTCARVRLRVRVRVRKGCLCMSAKLCVKRRLVRCAVGCPLVGSGQSPCMCPWDAISRTEWLHGAIHFHGHGHWHGHAHMGTPHVYDWRSKHFHGHGHAHM